MMFVGEWGFLSNFYESSFYYNNRSYQTVEHFFQTMKASNLYDGEKVRKQKTPGLAKRVGRSIKLREDWEEIKDEVMWIGLLCKFSQSPTLKRKLRVAPEYLCEGNYWHDNYWGNCTCSSCENIIGKNVLGEQLMKLRRLL